MTDTMMGADTSILRDEAAEMENLRPIPRISIQAFCESEAVARPIERAADDRRMAKAHVRVHMGGARAATEHYTGAPTPNLIIVESKALPADLAAELEGLADVCDPGSKVVIVGHHNDINLYRDLTRRGVSEYLVAPVTMADIVAVVGNLFTDPDAAPLGRVIAFVGSKGGVGASTVAHNVAWSASRLFASDVLLADLDLPFGTANINFDQDPTQGIAEAVFSAERLDEVFLDRLLAKCAEHLSLLAAPSLLDRTYDFGAEAFSALIDTAQRTTPIVVLDVPHAWNDWTKSVLGRVDEVAIVATPDLANLRNAKNLVDTLKRIRPNDRPPRLILNQLAVPKRPEIAAADFAEPLELEPIGLVNFDPAMFGNAANNGRMIGEVDAKHAAAETFDAIAHILTGRGEPKRAKRSGLDILARLRRK